ncbi:hypothetical protein F2P81_004872 [Scophthalmus maximus]|uniref:Uncharacterized protein n=1 Tax=Scophthalmus maximus TaxID=52904 RepID=A0A6A4TEB5_SCOMX|nr:hypothetical protein F2P81_004872 [Scophthalmus maximus]
MASLRNHHTLGAEESVLLAVFHAENPALQVRVPSPLRLMFECESDERVYIRRETFVTECVCVLWRNEVNYPTTWNRDRKQMESDSLIFLKVLEVTCRCDGTWAGVLMFPLQSIAGKMSNASRSWSCARREARRRQRQQRRYSGGNTMNLGLKGRREPRIVSPSHF